MSRKLKYKPGVRTTMNKFNQLLIGGTAMVSMLGWNINIAQAQSLPAYCTGSAIGALIGLAIGANPRAAANAIPAECRQNQYAPQNSSERGEEYYRQTPPRNGSQQRFKEEMDSYWEKQRELDQKSLRESNCLASSEGC
jgi:hypothetical protein